MLNPISSKKVNISTLKNDSNDLLFNINHGKRNLSAILSNNKEGIAIKSIAISEHEMNICKNLASIKGFRVKEAIEMSGEGRARKSDEEIKMMYENYIENMKINEIEEYHELTSTTLRRFKEEEGFKHSDTAFVLGKNLNKVKRMFQKFKENNYKYIPVETETKGGRIPILSPKQMEFAKEEIYKKTMAQQCFTNVDDFKVFIEVYHRLSLKEYGINNWDTKALKIERESIEKLFKKLCSGKSGSANNANVARLKKLVNFGRHLAHAATMYASKCDNHLKLYPESNTAVKYGLTSNEDGFSDVLGM